MRFKMSDEDQKRSTDVPKIYGTIHDFLGRLLILFAGASVCVVAVCGLSLLAYLVVVGDLVVLLDGDVDTPFLKFFFYLMFSPHVFLHVGIVVGLSWFGYVVYRVFFYKDPRFLNGVRSLFDREPIPEPPPLGHVSLVYVTILVVLALLQAKVLLNGGWDVAEMYEAYKLRRD
jgi:hypothetical protein